ncbi:MAG: TetR/AcrR family transcriptional regulator [Mycobacterium sp.]
MTSADGAAARPTVRGRDTQARLERAAREVIARKGFFKTTITDITSAAKRSPASFYHYFGSKEELLASLAEDFRAMARSRAVQALHPGQDLREIIQESVRAHWDTYREHLGVMVGVFQLAMIDDAFAQRWREMCADAIDGWHRRCGWLNARATRPTRTRSWSGRPSWPCSTTSPMSGWWPAATSRAANSTKKQRSRRSPIPGIAR